LASGPIDAVVCCGCGAPGGNLVGGGVGGCAAAGLFWAVRIDCTGNGPLGGGGGCSNCWRFAGGNTQNRGVAKGLVISRNAICEEPLADAGP
jgi:hypothetical protein